MGLFGKLTDNFKKYDELDLAREFKAEYEAGDLEGMRKIADKFVDHCHDSYFASCSMVIYIILLHNKDPFKVPPNKLNNLSIMERNIRFFDKESTDSLDDEVLEFRQWFRNEVSNNVKFMESKGYRFSSDD